MENQGITKVSTIYPEGNMTICTKYHEDITLKTINVNPLVTQGEKSEEYQCQCDSSSGDLECLYKSSWQSIQ